MFKSHPKGLLAAALSNMGERFGYYIMNAVLVLFLCSKFGLSDTTAGTIYSIFYAGIYVLSLVGGAIADRTQNYKGTITTGLIIMALGYIILAVPILATSDNTTWLLSLTCLALFFIAFGNGLFKGNLQAIVGQMYDNFEAEAAKKGEAELQLAKSKRDSGFQIFYVFINVGGLIAPFVAPLLREWWLKVNGFVYDAALPALCHQFLGKGDAMAASDVVAMLISLVIFLSYKKKFPTPTKKEVLEQVKYTAEEKAAMATEIKQRMFALFAVLGIAIFFWFSFHQNGMSLSYFARDFVDSSSIAPEIWQAINPFFVITLTPIIMWLFTTLAKSGKVISTPRKIGIGMGIAGLAYLFLALFSYIKGYPSAETFRALPVEEVAMLKSGPWVLIVLYFFLTVAELFISPLGLSFVSKVAPKHLQGFCQGLWLGATAVGNVLLWIGPLMYNKWPIWQCWSVFLIVCLISMGVMFGMVKWLERVTK